MVKPIALSAILLLVSALTQAKTTTAVTDGGNWTNVGTWDNGIPASGDVVNIPSGISVIVTSVVDLRGAEATTINLDGELLFDDPPGLASAALRLNGGDGDAINVSGSGVIDALDLLGGALTFGDFPLYWPAFLISTLGTTQVPSFDFDPDPITGPIVISNGALPVELVTFEARPENRHVVLTWVTASETNNEFFAVERTVDGEQFDVIAEVPGKGTSLALSHYSALDESPVLGRSYYRLRQTDFDGSYSFSPLVRVDYDLPDEPLLKIYPNPVDNQPLSIELNQVPVGMEVTLNLWSAQGQLIRRETRVANGSGRIQCEWPLSDVASGLYILKVGPTLALTQKVLVR